MGAPVTLVNADGSPSTPLQAGATVTTNENAYSFSHLTGAGTTTVKSGAGTLRAVVVNTKGTIASTITVKDNATVIGIIDSLNNVGTFTFNAACATSIVVVATATANLDFTVIYQ